MKAIVNNRYGGPEGLRLREIDRPELAADGALVRVHAASVNPYDWHVMRGTPFVVRAMTGLRRPRRPVIGVDYAGVVEAVGAEFDGDLAPGDEVFGGRDGSLAEYVCARKSIQRKPESSSFAEAAAVPIAGQTALQALRDHGALQEGQRVLINGAAGGVGTFAVQLAKALGASHVAGVCSTRNVELVRSLGADDVIDYTKEPLRGTYDLVVNAVQSASLDALRRRVADGGSVVLVAGPLHRVLTARVGKPSAQWFMAHHDRGDLLTLKELIEAGRVKPVIDRVYPLEEAAAAIRQLETGHARGKIVVEVS